MNRTGLIIALALSLATGLLFGLYPELDLKVAALFYDACTRTFPLNASASAAFARRAAMWIAWAMAAPAIVALVVKMIRPVKPLMMSGRAVAFLLITIFAAVTLSNMVFKTYWGRPRPAVVTEFAGKLTFKPWWDPTGDCPRYCSFFSGEGATAFWTYAPASLAPAPWRPLAYTAATVFGILRGVAQGDYTKLNLAYDRKNSISYFRTHSRPSIKFVDLNRFYHSCANGRTAKVMNLNLPNDGEVTDEFQSYTLAANQKLVDEGLADLASVLPDGALKKVAKYPDSFVCEF